MKKIGKLLYQPYKFLFGFPLFIISGIFFNSLNYIFCSIFDPHVGVYFDVSWCRTLAFFLPMFLKIKGKENYSRKESYVVVVNHKSNIDPIALCASLPIDLRWVMKAELRKVPLFGRTWIKRGNIMIDRKDRSSAIGAINEAKKTLKKGVSIILFPEGTRFSGKGLGPFKKGAFHIAIDTGLPILPVTMSGTDKIFPRGGIDITPGKVIVTIHKPIETKNLNAKDLDPLIEKVRGIIASAL